MIFCCFSIEICRYLLALGNEFCYNVDVKRIKTYWSHDHCFEKEEIFRMKNLRKNKKGFTLVEVIVVLLIVGILLAITIPSIMTYVGKAKDAQYEAEGRTGFVSAQTITATHNATNPTDPATITALAIGKDIGELASDATAVNANSTIQKAGCAFDANLNITKCAFVTKGSGDKYVVYEGNNEVTVTDTLPAGITEVK